MAAILDVMCIFVICMAVSCCYWQRLLLPCWFSAVMLAAMLDVMCVLGNLYGCHVLLLATSVSAMLVSCNTSMLLLYVAIVMNIHLVLNGCGGQLLFYTTSFCHFLVYFLLLYMLYLLLLLCQYCV